GHTEEGGYGITTSAVQKGQRLVVVVNGLANDKERIEEAERLIHHGFRDFKQMSFFKGGEKVEDAQVWMGEKATVPLVVQQPVSVILPRRAASAAPEMSLTYDTPLLAPVKKGDKLAEIKIMQGENLLLKVPVVAGEDVNKLSFLGRLLAIPQHYLLGK